MNQLSKLQQLFQDSVLHDGQPLSISWISPNGRTEPQSQLSVYSYAYKARLQEVLSNDFPAMLMAIGDEEFTELATDYIAAYPSQYFSLREFGKHMPDFIYNAIQKDQAYQDNLWLYELSLFEWTLGQSFDSADAELFQEHDMATIAPESWPDLKFDIHPSVQRLDLEWNTPQLWQALTSDTPTQVSAQLESSSPWLFWREQLVTRYRSIQADEQLALDTLLQGKNFNEICESLTNTLNDEDIPMCAAGFLKAWISQGLISGVH